MTIRWIIVFIACGGLFNACTGTSDSAPVETIQATDLTRSEQAATAEERAAWLFHLAQLEHQAQTKLQGEKLDQSRQRARAALLRVIEIGAGPVAEARHNLQLLLKDEPDPPDQEPPPPESSLPPQAHDLSDQIKQRPEDLKRMEELMQKNSDHSGEPVRILPVPLDQDY